MDELGNESGREGWDVEGKWCDDASKWDAVDEHSLCLQSPHLDGCGVAE